MANLKKIKRCLISVSDKSGIVELAKFLSENNVEVISTGGTKKLLIENGVNAKDISDFTNFPEIMDGRVKTLHPKVHGGLLGINDDENHQKQAKENDINSIDLLIVNLYPFVETVKSGKSDDEIIENVDIGGPAMVRSAAKNFAYKAVISDPSQYQELKSQLQKNDFATDFDFRKNMAAQAFQNIAAYDNAIANYFNGENNMNFSLNLKQKLRYGENSHQNAWLYQENSSENKGIVDACQIQGKELSYNNLNDADAAYNLACEFENPVCVIIKHASPCGVSSSKDHLESFKNAFNCDSKSAFGGIVAINGEIDENLAEEIKPIFFEVIIAKSISRKAQEILSTKKNLRILIADFAKNNDKNVKAISGGFLVQEGDNQEISLSDLTCASEKSVSNDKLQELVFAMKICKHVKSNAIVVCQNNMAIGVGTGQTSRVDACEIACKKAQNFQKENDQFGDLVLASDAFFPFADNIEIAAKNNIKAIIAPSGSVRDQEVIDAANKHEIALYFIKTRHFRH